MNEELKKYVQAWMDGEDVEYQMLSRTWYPIIRVIDFNEDYTFRIKPKILVEEEEVIDYCSLCMYHSEEWGNSVECASCKHYHDSNFEAVG